MIDSHWQERFKMRKRAPLSISPGIAAGNHSPEFFMDEGALEVGLRAMLQVALDYLHQ